MVYLFTANNYPEGIKPYFYILYSNNMQPFVKMNYNNTRLILMGMFLLLSITLFGQEAVATKVLMPEISGSYKGDSKDGLADGKGTAKGVDTYIGEFKKGLPEGKGKYTYKNGDNFNGFWSNGKKNGKGIFNFTLAGNAMTQKGYWKNGDYIGLTNPDEPYIVSDQSGLQGYTIKKTGDGAVNKIVFNVMSGPSKIVPGRFEIHTSSGQSQGVGKNLFINNFTIPMNCSVRFAITKQYTFAFEITQPGEYEVTLNTQ